MTTSKVQIGDELKVLENDTVHRNQIKKIIDFRGKDKPPPN